MKIPDNLKKEFNFYIANQDDLVKKYAGKWLVISNEQVRGDFNSNREAYSFGILNYIQGDFIIQLCSEGKDAYTQTFNQVSFA